ncbi:cellulose biosynthesis protein BcsN [Ancylobacter sp.]|uniref:cellulose biosynthesis protein BcsN n=1 Tax=Ancylobacter sp. TaxID=1872567 RepID=UPI003D0A3685
MSAMNDSSIGPGDASALRERSRGTMGRVRALRRPLLAAGCVLLLGGCGLSRGGAPVIATMAIEVPSVEALILPDPGGPRVVGVIETRYANALEQKVFVGTDAVTPGQNAFHVIFFGPVESRTGKENIQNDTFLAQDALAEEMESAMPGVDMRPSNYFVENRYGPFGYALGRGTGRDLCIYAWQRIQSHDRVNVVSGDRGVLSVRLRLCEAGATEASLLRVMYRYTINGYFLPRSWQPYGRPLPEPVGIGRIGGPNVYPGQVYGAPDPSLAPAQPVSQPRAPSRAAAPVQEVVPDVPAAPLEGYPTVPAPQ